MRELGAACGGRRVESAHRSPLHVMEDAYSAARLPGAATCCVVCLDAPRKFLHTANLGDSGFLIARKGRVLYKSPSQQHSLNCPFQLGSASQDRPADAQLASFEVEAGDHVLLASDGLWDNLYVDQIMALLEGADSVERGAESLAREAHRWATAPHWLSPFARQALVQECGLPDENGFSSSDAKALESKLKASPLAGYLGGKLDDTAVVLAELVEENEEPNMDSILERHMHNYFCRLEGSAKEGPAGFLGPPARLASSVFPV
eukprot:Polyplicarium_translucidae@DN2034_c0_g1_i1.p2